MSDWLELTTEIKNIEQLLETHEIEITSPDGWVTVSEFVDKGKWVGYKCTHLDTGNFVIVNENHLFLTTDGWEFAKDLHFCHILTEHSEEYESYYIERLDNEHDIVDIQVDHPEHRYYANGVCSHNTHVGKTLLMCNIAASSYMRGANVLYITLEESENKIRQRIDSNLLNIDMDDLIGVDREKYFRQLNSIKGRIKSRLVVKEFPTASVSALHFKALLAELKLKEGFVPDLICIDYLGLCLSERGGSAGENSNTKLQGISEEIRGFMQGANAAGVTGQQLNRGGAVDNSDPDMSDVADSFGSLFVADFVIIGVAPKELKAKKMMMFIQQKNRHRNISYKPRFIVGVDTDNMRIYDIDDPSMTLIHDADTPIMDNTPTGKRLTEKAERFKGLK